MPPTKGASPMNQFLPPIYWWSVLPPQLTAIPKMIKICKVSLPPVWKGRPGAIGTYHNCDYFEQAEPVFDLTVDSHRQNVQCNDDDEENQTNRPSWEIIRPVFQQQLQCNNIRRGSNGIVEPVIPSQGKAKGIIDEASESVNTHSSETSLWLNLPRKCTKRSGHRHKGGHLPQAQHGHKDDATADDVRN